jgi:protein-S-isoprenylcysteine O-methyltransferase Ste14
MSGKPFDGLHMTPIINGLAIAGLASLIVSVAAGMMIVPRGRRIAYQEPMRVKAASILVLIMGCAWCIVTGAGTFRLPMGQAAAVVRIAGCVLFCAGAALNIAGRLALGTNWSDENTVYTDHRLVVTGPYRHVRHPLFTALMLLFAGAALMYQNGAVALVACGVLAPMLLWRARREEHALTEFLSQYETYMKNVPMFFPSLPRLLYRSGEKEDL